MSNLVITPGYMSLVKEEVSKRHIQIEGRDKEIALLYAFVKKDIAQYAKEYRVRDVSLQNPEIATRIEALIQYYSYFFKRICEAQFPFDLVDPATSKALFTHCLKNFIPPFVRLLTRDKNVENLDDRFGHIYQALQTPQIAEACYDLHVKSEDNKIAGYCLLWVLKQLLGPDCVLPATASECTSAQVDATASSWFCKEQELPLRFLEMLFSSDYGHSLYRDLLSEEQKELFLAAAIKRFQSVPMESWPTKRGVIRNILKVACDEDRHAVAAALVESSDAETKAIGTHALAAFECTSIRDLQQHFTQLGELLRYTRKEIESIFGKPFVKFKPHEGDPECIRQVIFDRLHQVFIQDSLLIGIYQGKMSKPYLIACNQDNNELVWGIPLANEYKLQQDAGGIYLHFTEENTLRYIQASTGQVQSTVTFPFALLTSYITPEQTAYQLANISGCYTLVGGKIAEGRMEQSFTDTDPPGGGMLSLSTHIGFQDEDRLVLVGPTGHKKAIEHVLSAAAKERSLYLIQMNPETGMCVLTKRSLVDTEHVFSNIEQEISLDEKRAGLLTLCDNDQCIVFAKTRNHLAPIFVNLRTGTVSKSLAWFNVSAMHVINTQAAEVWLWQKNKKSISKISLTEKVQIAKFESDQEMVLVHVDVNGLLYFGVIP